MAKERTTSSGEIRADAVYGLSEFMERSGLRSWAVRSMRRNGLPVRRCGSRSFIKGADFIAFVEQNGKLVGSLTGGQS